MGPRIFLRAPPTHFPRLIQQAVQLPFSVPPSVERHSSGTGIINPFSIAYAFRPRLRGRLTLGRLALPRKPQVYGEQVSHLLYRYSCPHMHFQGLQPSSRSTFTADGTLPYQTTTGEPAMESVASVPSLSPAEFSAQIHLTSELLRTLSMVAASEPTSWLSMRIYILYHLAWI